VNNATELQSCFENNICPEMRNHYKLAQNYSQNIVKNTILNYSALSHNNNHNIFNNCSVWWISTHYRMRGYFPDESTAQIKSFNEDMRAFFDHSDHKCGVVNTIDVYNMTSQLGLNHTEEAKLMTYDQVHWGMEVNLIKVQIILKAVLSGDANLWLY
jgi:hypothetical protein